MEKNDEPKPYFYTEREAAKLLGVSTRTVRRRMHSGALAACEQGAVDGVDGKSLRANIREQV